MFACNWVEIYTWHTLWWVCTFVHTWVTHPGIKKIYIISDGKCSHVPAGQFSHSQFLSCDLDYVLDILHLEKLTQHVFCSLWNLLLSMLLRITHVFTNTILPPFDDFNSILWYLYITVYLSSCYQTFEFSVWATMKNIFSI